MKGGKCEPCDCSNNVDPLRAGNCDPSTGQCHQCLYDTEGFRCEFCKSGFYGDALQQSCRGTFFSIFSNYMNACIEIFNGKKTHYLSRVRMRYFGYGSKTWPMRQVYRTMSLFTKRNRSAL